MFSTYDCALQSSRISRSPIKRLTRKDRSRRGKPDVSVSVGATSSTHGSTCHSKLTGSNITVRRQTLLLEDRLNLAAHSLRDSFCSCPDLSTDAAVSGSRSLLLHQTADRDSLLPSPSCPQGESKKISWRESNSKANSLFLFLWKLAFWLKSVLWAVCLHKLKGYMDRK